VKLVKEIDFVPWVVLIMTFFSLSSDALTSWGLLALEELPLSVSASL
jgi:hypothetical protein